VGSMPNEFGLGGPSADGRPAPTEGAAFVSAEADAWRAAPGEADFNRREKAFGRWSAWVPNEFGLKGPLAGGRPAPTEGTVFASAEANAWRAAPGEADFHRREGLRPMVGLGAE